MTILFISILVLLGLIILVEFIFVVVNGQPVPKPETPRSVQTFGREQKQSLNYVVMGDSTAVGQGAKYENSYGVLTARELSKKYKVELLNTAVSGARTKDVLENQAETAAKHKPDIAVIGVGANDVTHFTNPKNVQTNIEKVIELLQSSNQDVAIILTGSPAMDTPPRFLWLTKSIMHQRTQQLNRHFDKVVFSNKNVYFAQIAAKTRGQFLANPKKLFSQDNFHPNDSGYALWAPIIYEKMEESLKVKNE